MGQDPLPSFEDPPVIETVLGVEFAPIPWMIPHFGMYWSELKTEYTSFEIKPPIASQIEQFGKQAAQISGGPKIEILSVPEVRCWYVRQDGTRLVQVQNNRFCYNWRKHGHSPYPRFETIRSVFETEWQRFTQFVKREKLGQVEAIQCEVSYVNHIEQGKGWNTAADIPKLIPAWSGNSSGSYLPSPESVRIGVTYQLPEHKGRLRVSLDPAIRNSDGKEVLQLTLTARKKPASSEFAEIVTSIKLAREWVVRGFTDFTSKSAHNLWGRTS